MASPNPSNVCFICLKQSSINLNEEKSFSSQRGTFYKQFTSFVRSYLQITTAENSSDGQVSDWENHGISAGGIEAFCEGCSETVSNICELYKELCSVELRLSTKLEELGIILKDTKKPIPTSNRDDLSTSSLLKSLAVQLSLPTEAVYDLRNSILSKLIHKSIKSKDSVNLNVANYAQEEIEPNTTEIIKEEVESLPDYDDDGENQNQFGSEDDCSESSDNRDDEENSNESDSEDNDTYETEQVGDSGAAVNVGVDFDNSEDEDDYEENPTSSDIESDESSFEMDTDEDEDITFSPTPKRRRNLPPKTTSQPKRNAESYASIKKMFACEANECRQYFDNITKLNAHLKTHSTTIHSCCECNRGFLNPDLLTLHKLLHSKRVSGAYPCPSRSCSTKLHTAKQLQSHYNIKHGLGLGCFKCPKCELNLASESSFIAHLNKHDEAQDPSLPISEALHCIAAPPCSICGLQFLRLQNLDEHRKEIHKLGVECPTCKKLYSNRTALRIHRINHHKLDAEEIVCEACGKSYKNRSYLREHMVNMHPDLVSREGLHQCSHCFIRFYRKHHLVNHLSKCQKNPNPVKIAVVRRKPSQKKVTPCHVCGKLVKGGSYDLKMHLRSHQPKPITSSSCRVCKEVVEQPFLRNHMETHKRKRKPKVKNEAGDQDMDDDEDEQNRKSFEMDTDEDEDITFSPTPKRRRNLPPKTTSQPKRNAESYASIKKMFACEANECRQYFDNITKLNAHLKTHSTTIHSCCECNRGFLNPDLLTLHKLLHSKRVSGAYPCPSRSCSTKLHTAKQLQSHYNIKHGLGLGCFKCPKCELNLASESSFIAHLNKHDEAQDPSLPISEALHCIAAPPCSICGLQFLRLQNLDEHRKEIHKLGVECPTCKKLYSNRTALRIHRINHHKLDAEEIVCEACGKSYKNRSYLREHMVNMHPDLVSREGLHQCSHCFIRFYRKHHLVNHLSKCQKNPNPVKIAVVRRKPSQKKVTPCHVCGKLVKGGSYDLKMHLRSHQPKPITSSSCRVCKEVVEQPFLRNHMETHKRKRKPKVKNEAGDQDMDDDEDEQNRKSQRKAEILAYMDKMFACDAPECRTYYKDIAELNSHLETHSSTIYSCSECERGFLHPEILELHKLLHTEKIDDKYPCPSSSCSTKYDNPKQLQSHFNIKHGIGLGCFKCPKCELNLATEKSFIKHLIKTKHDEDKDPNLSIREAPRCIAAPCSVCGLQFMGLNYLDIHRKNVHKLGVECTTCNTFYINRISLNQHIHRRHKLDVGQIIRRKRKKTSPALDMDNNINSSSTQCEVCGKLVKGSSKQMQRHLDRSHSTKALPCKICGLLVEGPNRLQHMESHHNTKQKEIKEPFICYVCGEKFNYNKTLNYHLNRRHGIRKDADEKRVQCDICGNSYSSKGNLALHQLTHNDERPFPCHLCPYKANFNACLKSHLVLMHGKVKGQEFAQDDGGPTGRKRNCRYPSCKQVFFDESELKSHVEQEHQAPNDEISAPTFMCNLCGRTFANQQRLTRHNQVHSEVKPYSCDICQKPLSHRSAVKEHLQNIHGIGKEKEFFSCTQPNCNSSTKFKSRTYLYRHLRGVHGILMKNHKKN